MDVRQACRAAPTGQSGGFADQRPHLYQVNLSRLTLLPGHGARRSRRIGDVSDRPRGMTTRLKGDFANLPDATDASSITHQKEQDMFRVQHIRNAMIAAPRPAARVTEPAGEAGSRRHGRRPIFSALAAVAAAASLLAAPTAHATVLTYTISPGATLQFGSDTETLSGSFSFDTSTNDLDSIDLSISGPLLTFTYDTLVGASIRTDLTGGLPKVLELGGNENGTDTLLIKFGDSLSLDEADPLVAGDPGTDCDCNLYETPSGTYLASSVSGDADPAPEPPSLALLGAAVGLFLVARQVSRPAA